MAIDGVEYTGASFYRDFEQISGQRYIAEEILYSCESIADDRFRKTPWYTDSEGMSSVRPHLTITLGIVELSGITVDITDLPKRKVVLSNKTVDRIEFNLALQFELNMILAFNLRANGCVYGGTKLSYCVFDRK